MTTIAWDGALLAGDSLMLDGGMRINTVKIFRLNNGSLISGAGDTFAVLAFIDWMNARGRVEIPDFGEEGEFSAIVIHPDKTILLYDRRCVPMVIKEPHYAIGSGAAHAMTAMDLGYDAPEAVHWAILRDGCSGGDIDVLSFEEHPETTGAPVATTKTA